VREGKVRERLVGRGMELAWRSIVLKMARRVDWEEGMGRVPSFIGKRRFDSEESEVSGEEWGEGIDGKSDQKANLIHSINGETFGCCLKVQADCRI
jgi:hypothetical protein